MLRYLCALGAGLAFALNLGCSLNILQPFGDQSTDQALYDSALSSINNGDYNGALTTIAKMSTGYATTKSAVELKASAYGGLAGLNFLTFANNISNLGSTLLFPFLLGQFKLSSAVGINSAESAEAALLSLGSASTLSNDDNFFLAMIEMGKIGNILSFYTDPTKSGTPTAGFDPCAVGASQVNGGNMTDADARQLGSAMTIALASFSAVSAVISTGSSSFAPVSAICSALPASYNFCSITDPSAFTASQVKGIRSLVKENAVIGLGTNCSGDISVCFCP